MAYIIPSVADFKNYFTRDWPYDPAVAPPYDLSKVQDSDITKAIAEASFNFNEELFSTQEQFTIGYLYLTAHYMVMDLRASAQGIAGQYSWLQSSKSVGSVAEGFTIPQRIQDIPSFAMLSKTNYGAKYLSLILPQMVGQMFSTPGRTSPV